MFLIAANFVFAQNHTSGIYKSSEDYKEGKSNGFPFFIFAIDTILKQNRTGIKWPTKT